MSTILDEIRETEPINIDYVGFTFNGIHSSQLKILSVSDGSRYNRDLLPTIEDYSIDITGATGMNYFGGNFKKRDIVLNIAFDEVDERHLRAIRELFSEREVHELYLDEEPYKVYNAVISKTPSIKFIAFGDVGTRVYKGEGQLVFTCYDPIAYTKNGNYLDDYESENIEEWGIASGMLDNKHLYQNNTKIENYYDTPRVENNKLVIHAFNAGILPTPIRLDLNWVNSTLEIKNNTTNKFLRFVGGEMSDMYIRIDTERSVALQLETEEIEKEVEGQIVTEVVPKRDENGEAIETTTVLNQLVEDGRFFLLAPGLNELEITGGTVIDNGYKFYHRYL